MCRACVRPLRDQAPAGSSGDARLAVGLDVTALVGKAAAASQEVHDLKRLIDCANAPIFGINATALITEWNRKATEITGRSKWEVVGRRLEEFIRPEDRASVVEVRRVSASPLPSLTTPCLDLPVLTCLCEGKQQP